MKANHEVRDATLKASLDTMARARNTNRKSHALVADKTLQNLTAALVAGRNHAGLTPAEVAALMWTTKSVVSRLESGRCTRPTMGTIEKCALAVGCKVEIKFRSER